MQKIFTKAQPTTINEKDYTMDVVMSIEVKDRQGDIVDINSISTENFELNPVVIPFHDYDEMSVGKVIKIWKELKEGKMALMATIKFAVDEYPVAKTMFNLYKGGYMNAFSIGFQVGRVETNTETGVTTLYDCELLELSCVTVPANQLALAKSKGIEMKDYVKILPQNFYKEVKDLMISIKEMLTEDSGDSDEDKEGNDAKNAPKTEDKPKDDTNPKDTPVTPVKPDFKAIKTQILKRALEKAIRSVE